MDIHLLETGLACVDTAMAAVSWLILLCTYPDFARWRKEGFAEAHELYTRRVGRIVGPLLLLQMSGHAYGLYLGGAWAGAALVGAAWAITAFWSVPCHRRLQVEGPDSPAVAELVRSHVWRTLLWSVVAGISLVRALLGA